MRTRHFVAQIVFFTAALVVAIVDIVFWATALHTLTRGPSTEGYNLLETAAAWLPAVVAALLVIGLIARSLAGYGRTIVRVGGLALACGITAAVAAGLQGLGRLLSQYDIAVNANIAEGGSATNIYSLHMAILGVGTQLLTVPVVLAVGTLLVLATAGLRPWWRARRFPSAASRVEPTEASIPA